MRIREVVFGKTTLPESMIFEGGERDKIRRIALRSFLIETAGRTILVDAGCDTMPGFVVEDHIGPLRALEDMGVSADSVTDLILTHHHHDHAECADRFINAVVYIQRDEYPLTERFISKSSDVILFDEEYSVCDGVRVIRIGGHTVGSCIVSVRVGDDEYIITGDECYHSDCLKYGIPTGCAYSRERATAFIEKYSNEKYKVLVMHELTLETEI